MIMKRLFAFIGLLMSVLALAQNPEVESRLKMRYPLVQYHQECGGWYFLSYNSVGQPMYGFARCCCTAGKNKMHSGFCAFRTSCGGMFLCQQGAQILPR